MMAHINSFRIRFSINSVVSAQETNKQTNRQTTHAPLKHQIVSKTLFALERQPTPFAFSI